VPRFERSQPNDLWHIDLIEKKPTAIGAVYGIPVLDDHSRYLLALRFFLTKDAQTALDTTYLAMHEHGTPAAIMSDHGGQFVDATGMGTTTFQGMLHALGIQPLLISRPQTNGKEERVNQFIERDFLDEVRW
jgi:transposase InsO family protein